MPPAAGMHVTMDQLLFWTIAFAGAVLAGWWLAVRPGQTPRGAATTVSCLILLMAVALCLLVLLAPGGASQLPDPCQLAYGR